MSFFYLEEEQEVLLALGNVDETDDRQLGKGSGEGDIQPAVTEHDRINFAVRVRLTIKKQRMEKLLRGEISRFRRV